jgi:hypothetical protein
VSAARRLALLALLVAASVQADPWRNAPAVPLPRAPSSLPPAPWEPVGRGPYGWGAVGIVIADPRFDPGFDSRFDFPSRHDPRGWHDGAPPATSPWRDPSGPAAVPPVRW